MITCGFLTNHQADFEWGKWSVGIEKAETGMGYS